MDASFLSRGIGPEISNKDFHFANELIIYTETPIDDAMLSNANPHLNVIIDDGNNAS